MPWRHFAQDQKFRRVHLTVRRVAVMSAELSSVASASTAGELPVISNSSRFRQITLAIDNQLQID
jgi:hypothetical protein